MVAPASPLPVGEGNTPAQNLPSQPPSQIGGRRWYIDEIVVAAFAFLGVGGAILLSVFTVVAPILVSFLLATGLAALTYRYLGGIDEKNSFKIGALKLTGTLAALVGIAMLINHTLEQQSKPVQVWYLHATVTDGTQNPIAALNDGDFAVSPSAAHADQLGQFHVEYIYDPTVPGANLPFLTVKHGGYGQVTLPLELGQLKTQYPDAKINGKFINIDHIVLPKANGVAAPYANDAPPPPVLQQGQLPAYNATAQSAKPADPNSGGLPK